MEFTLFENCMFKGAFVGPNIKGVFQLGRYPFINKDSNIVHKIFRSHNFINESLSMDFNDVDDTNLGMKSTISLMGVDTSNLKFGDDGILYSNSEPSEHFVLKIQGSSIDGSGIYQPENSNSLAVIATAHRYIAFPIADFKNLVTYYESVASVNYQNQRF